MNMMHRFIRLIPRGFGIIMILIIIFSLIPASPIAGNGSNTVDTNDSQLTRSRQSFTHTVFAEDFTAEWCVYCPSASETLNEVYNSGDYGTNFYFVCMITQDKNSSVLNQDAQDRANEMDISGYPTVEFDGGYYEVVGAQSDDTNYRDAIETCGSRDVPDLDIGLTAQYLGDAQIAIDAKVTNNDVDSYSGTLKVYVVEIVSRYFDYDGNHYPFGFLDYAIDTGIDVPSSNTITKSTTWDGAAVVDGQGNDFGDIDQNNIIIYATIMNDQSTPYRERIMESSKIFNLHLIDEAAATYLSDTPPVINDDDPPEIEMISPVDNDEVSGTVRIEAAVTDQNAVIKVEYQYENLNNQTNQGIWTTMYKDEFNNYFRFWDTKYVPDGTYIISVRAFDSRNNLGLNTVNIFIKNDYDDPKVEFNNIVEDQQLTDVFSLKVKAIDDTGIKKVQYRIDDGSWNNMQFIGNNEYTADFDTTSLSDGEHELTILAEDIAGKKVSNTITFMVKNKKESNPISTTPGFEGFIFIGVLMILVIYITRTRIRKDYKN